jgi:hypothetical protein
MSVAPAAGAAGAAGGAGALGALGPWMFAAQGLNFLGDAIGGNQQSQALAAQTKLQGLYTKLAPVNTRIAFAGQELMANIAPYLGAESAQTNLIGQSIYDMFTGARSKESQQAGLQTGLASMFVQAAGDVQKTAAMGRVATGLKGMETQAKLAEKGADVLGLQYTNLAKGITDVGTSAANMRNKLLENQQIANLETAKGLALERGRGEREEMHRRSARSAALNAGGFA